MALRLLYFARVRQDIGLGGESVTPPAHVGDTGALLAWLTSRGDGYARAFRDRDAIRVSVDRELAGWDRPLTGGEEVAFFPPVTGG